MYAGYHEEGDRCPECHKGRIDWPPKNCSCHIDPPCCACTEARLLCSLCGWEDERPDYKDVPYLPGISAREYAPKPLDPTKIDYRAKSHTSGSMIKEGVCPEGTTRKDVEMIVRGSWGGRFESFGGGKFKYIAYTD